MENTINVYAKFYDSFSFAYSVKITKQTIDNFDKMKKGVGSCFSHFNKQQQIRQDLKVVEVREATQGEANEFL